MKNCNIKITFCAASILCFLLPVKLTSLALQPVMSPELAQGRVYLKCTFSHPSSKPLLQYMVVWSRLSTSGKKEQIQRDTTLQSFSYIEMNSINLRLGDTVMQPRLQLKRSNIQGDQILFLNLCFVFISAALHSLYYYSCRKKYWNHFATRLLNSFCQIQDL